MENKKILIAAIISLSLMLGCGGGGGGSDGPTIEEANQLFGAGSYTDALTAYLALITDQGSAARSGAGWCYIRLNNFTEANAQFTAAAGDNLPDANAGWSVVYWAQNDPTNAVAKADAVLAAQPNWVLSIDTRVDKDDLIYIQAASYLQLQKYGLCLSKIKAIESSYNPTISASASDSANVLLEKIADLGAASAI